MKLKTHYIISKIAAEKQNGLSPCQIRLFCIGSVLPDLSPMQFIHRHFYAKSADFVFMKLKKLNGKSSAMAMLAYGNMAHYCSDFCCSVHFQGSVGNPIKHLQYEKALAEFAGKHLKELAEKEYCPSTYSRLTDLYSDYNNTEKYNCICDLSMAIQACMLICSQAAKTRCTAHKHTTVHA